MLMFIQGTELFSTPSEYKYDCRTHGGGSAPILYWSYLFTFNVNKVCDEQKDEYERSQNYRAPGMLATLLGCTKLRKSSAFK